MKNTIMYHCIFGTAMRWEHRQGELMVVACWVKKVQRTCNPLFPMSVSGLVLCVVSMGQGALFQTSNLKAKAFVEFF